MAAKITNYTTKESWLKARHEGLGGSDAGAVMGLNAYKSRADVLKEKVEAYKPKIEKEKAHQTRGHDCEEPIKNLFWIDHKPNNYTDRKRCGKYTIISNAEHPWLMGTPDSEIVSKDKDGKEVYGLLEIKTGRVYNRDYDMHWKHKMPDSYYVQVLHYLLVNDEYKFAYLRAYLTHEDSSVLMRMRTMQDYAITRENEVVMKDLDLLFVEELKFWGEVEKARGTKNDILPSK